MQTATQLKVASTHTDDDTTTTVYECDFIADCDGSSIWGNTHNKKVHVTGITVCDTVYDGNVYKSIYVKHDSEWEIYTDTGFAQAISAALGYAVSFTEQGMQEDGIASME